MNRNTRIVALFSLRASLLDALFGYELAPDVSAGLLGAIRNINFELSFLMCGVAHA